MANAGSGYGYAGGVAHQAPLTRREACFVGGRRSSAAATRDGWLILLLNRAVRRIHVVQLPKQRRVAVGALDHVIGGAVGQEPALARPEVDRLGVVGD